MWVLPQVTTNVGNGPYVLVDIIYNLTLFAKTPSSSDSSAVPDEICDVIFLLKESLRFVFVNCAFYCPPQVIITVIIVVKHLLKLLCLKTHLVAMLGLTLSDRRWY